jgi:hypothetical protein
MTSSSGYGNAVKLDSSNKQLAPIAKCGVHDKPVDFPMNVDKPFAYDSRPGDGPIAPAASTRAASCDRLRERDDDARHEPRLRLAAA